MLEMLAYMKLGREFRVSGQMGRDAAVHAVDEFANVSVLGCAARVRASWRARAHASFLSEAVTLAADNCCGRVQRGMDVYIIKKERSRWP